MSKARIDECFEELHEILDHFATLCHTWTNISCNSSKHSSILVFDTHFVRDICHFPKTCSRHSLKNAPHWPKIRNIRFQKSLENTKFETFVKNLVKTGQNSKHSQNPLFRLKIRAEKNESKKCEKWKAKFYSTVTKAPQHTSHIFMNE